MKHLLTPLTLLCILTARAQQPPLLNSFSYTHIPGQLITCLNYTANDTGIVLVQFQLSKIDLGDVYIDQYFQTPADTDEACFTIYNIYPCVKHYVTVNLSNAHAYGPVANPLFVFYSSCVSGCEELQPVRYALAVHNRNIFVKCNDVQAGAALHISDLQGRTIGSMPLVEGQQHLSLFEWGAGIYILRITENGREALTEKIAIY
ncbi:MAG: hypothetical protein NZM35_11010 [Chitinophagales bacterium]|nr:hypothetical protein [Chitinophagales bacterium]MDW8419858.1 hypothetical protein [Chitinophagales bacterium]